MQLQEDKALNLLAEVIPTWQCFDAFPPPTAFQMHFANHLPEEGIVLRGQKQPMTYLSFFLDSFCYLKGFVERE